MFNIIETIIELIQKLFDNSQNIGQFLKEHKGKLLIFIISFGLGSFATILIKDQLLKPTIKISGKIPNLSEDKIIKLLNEEEKLANKTTAISEQEVKEVYTKDAKILKKILKCDPTNKVIYYEIHRIDGITAIVSDYNPQNLNPKNPKTIEDKHKYNIQVYPVHQTANEAVISYDMVRGFNEQTSELDLRKGQESMLITNQEGKWLIKYFFIEVDEKPEKINIWKGNQSPEKKDNHTECLNR
jgi:hypothetical protein